jgi:hypothetical protein
LRWARMRPLSRPVLLAMSSTLIAFLLRVR